MIFSNLDFSIRVVDHKIPERKEEREQPPGFSYEWVIFPQWWLWNQQGDSVFFKKEQMNLLEQKLLSYYISVMKK